MSTNRKTFNQKTRTNFLSREWRTCTWKTLPILLGMMLFSSGMYNSSIKQHILPKNGKGLLRNSHKFHIHKVEKINQKNNKFDLCDIEMYKEIHVYKVEKVYLLNSFKFHVHDVEKFNQKTLKDLMFQKQKIKKAKQISYPQTEKQFNDKIHTRLMSTDRETFNQKTRTSFLSRQWRTRTQKTLVFSE